MSQSKECKTCGNRFTLHDWEQFHGRRAPDSLLFLNTCPICPRAEQVCCYYCGRSLLNEPAPELTELYQMAKQHYPYGEHACLLCQQKRSRAIKSLLMI